jgi:hypothetical protein
MNRLILLVESRIRGNVYVRFGGEYPKTHRSNTAGRRMLSLHISELQNNPNYSIDASNTVYIIFMLIGIVGYFTIPTVANWIISAGGITGYNRNIQTTAAKTGAAAGAVSGAISGNISGRLLNRE